MDGALGPSTNLDRRRKGLRLPSYQGISGQAGGPAFELEFLGASSFVVFEGAGFRFPDPRITGHSEDEGGLNAIRGNSIFRPAVRTLMQTEKKSIKSLAYEHQCLLLDFIRAGRRAERGKTLKVLHEAAKAGPFARAVPAFPLP